MNDRIDTRPYFMLISTERRLRTHEFANSFTDMASAFLPGSKPIADEAYDKNCLACVDFYDYLATAMIEDISIHALREEGDSKNGEKHLRFCFIIKRSAQIWKSLSKNIRKNSCDLHRMP